jgi:hypothetical protein
MDGKAMVVCMSRRICVDLYNAIIKLRPDWHYDDDDKGIIKIIMTGSAADPPEWQPHVRSKSRREELAKRFKDAKDSSVLRDAFWRLSSLISLIDTDPLAFRCCNILKIRRGLVTCDIE